MAPEGKPTQIVDRLYTHLIHCPVPSAVVAGEPHDGQLADCYSLGATLFYLSFGRTPFVGKGAQKNAKLLDLYDQIKHAPLQFLGPMDSGLKDLISRFMHKDPMQRLRLPEALRHPWLLDSDER